MARNQVWDSEGNLIEDVEVPDEVITDAKAEAIAEIESATTIAGLRAAMLKYVNAE